MAEAFTMAFDPSELLAQLVEFSLDVKRQVIRPAAQAGAQVFYDEARVLCPVATKPHKTKSGRVIAPGALKASLYQAFSADNSGEAVATYHISWNARKAPHGHLIENGHWTRTVGKYGPLKPRWVPAHSFIRRSYENAGARALTAVSQRLDTDLTQLLAKIA